MLATAAVHENVENTLRAVADTLVIISFSTSRAVAATGFAFQAETLTTTTTQTLHWSVTCFFASAAASAAYLTGAENFPLEMRALAIAIFYALGTLLGAAAPWVFGLLIESGSRSQMLLGYLFGAAPMILAAAVTALIDVAADRKPLEEVTRPLNWNCVPRRRQAGLTGRASP